MKQLTSEVENLRQENESLKEQGGAVGGGGNGGDNINSNCNGTYHRRAQQISRELMIAASTAENNLR